MNVSSEESEVRPLFTAHGANNTHTGMVAASTRSSHHRRRHFTVTECSHHGVLALYDTVMVRSAMSVVSGSHTASAINGIAVAVAVADAAATGRGDTPRN